MGIWDPGSKGFIYTTLFFLFESPVKNSFEVTGDHDIENELILYSYTF